MEASKFSDARRALFPAGRSMRWRTSTVRRLHLGQPSIKKYAALLPSERLKKFEEVSRLNRIVPGLSLDSMISGGVADCGSELLLSDINH